MRRMLQDKHTQTEWNTTHVITRPNTLTLHTSTHTHCCMTHRNAARRPHRTQCNISKWPCLSNLAVVTSTSTQLEQAERHEGRAWRDSRKEPITTVIKPRPASGFGVSSFDNAQEHKGHLCPPLRSPEGQPPLSLRVYLPGNQRCLDPRVLSGRSLWAERASTAPGLVRPIMWEKQRAEKHERLPRSASRWLVLCPKPCVGRLGPGQRALGSARLLCFNFGERQKKKLHELIATGAKEIPFGLNVR